jgi:protein ImuA
MPALKADIITQLKKDILALQGFRPLVHAQHKIDLGTINHSFPHSTFPLGANHEFICNSKENLAASSGFIAGILSTLLQKGGAIAWIGSSHIIFPPALVSFDIEPSQVIFIHLRNQKEILWTVEEALKCEGLTAVVGELSSIDLTVSRRLQLAAEQSRVTGFLLRYPPKQLNTTACVCRWQIHSLKSETENGLPGVGFPRWAIELLKVRNGKPGRWQLEWANGQFNEVMMKTDSTIDKQKQAV